MVHKSHKSAEAGLEGYGGWEHTESLNVISAYNELYTSVIKADNIITCL